MASTKSDRIRALRTLCGAIYGDNNLIGTDFGDVQARRMPERHVDGGLVQDASGGVRIQFTISNHALGKVIANNEIDEALETLLQATD